ncbi:hypothetical protein KCP76_19905 [Salmonella enterica subsp. enterica serovar Weltevreden]|nr:hypothetical protein KCP76_19905 [Salmonella enterica subsp. enterica serovar Weltevreden]
MIKKLSRRRSVVNNHSATFPPVIDNPHPPDGHNSFFSKWIVFGAQPTNRGVGFATIETFPNFAGDRGSGARYPGRQ